MKIALIFLMPVFVVICQQQLHRVTMPEELTWPPYSPQPVYYPPFYPSPLDNYNPFFFRSRPWRPPIHPVNKISIKLKWMCFGNDLLYIILQVLPVAENGKEIVFPDVQSRRGSNQEVDEEAKPRFFNYLPVGANNFFFRTTTITWTLMSTVNVTTVQSCITSTAFQFIENQYIPCRRKRDILDEHFDSIEDVQFPIIPSETQQ